MDGKHGENRLQHSFKCVHYISTIMMLFNPIYAKFDFCMKFLFNEWWVSEYIYANNLHSCGETIEERKDILYTMGEKMYEKIINQHSALRKILAETKIFRKQQLKPKRKYKYQSLETDRNWSRHISTFSFLISDFLIYWQIVAIFESVTQILFNIAFHIQIIQIAFRTSSP